MRAGAADAAEIDAALRPPAGAPAASPRRRRAAAPGRSCARACAPRRTDRARSARLAARGGAASDACAVMPAMRWASGLCGAGADGAERPAARAAWRLSLQPERAPRYRCRRRSPRRSRRPARPRPRCTRISASWPVVVDGTSIDTLSVSISNRLSPGLTASPADLNHLVILPSATVSPSCGISTSMNSPSRRSYPVILRCSRHGRRCVRTAGRGARASKDAGPTVAVVLRGATSSRTSG